MNKYRVTIHFKQLVGCVLAVLFLVTLSACTSPDMETMEKNIRSGDPQVVDRAVKQLMQILKAAEGDNTSPLYKADEKQNEALKIIVENMKDIPQCKEAIVELLKEKYKIWDVTYCAKEYLDLSLFDDDTINAFATYGNQNSYFSRFLDTVPVPDRYEKILGASSDFASNSMDYTMGKAVVFRGIDDQYYTLDAITFVLPEEHRVALYNLADADTVVRICDYKIAEGVYTNNVTAYRINTVLAIYDTKTQRLVHSVTFKGGDPNQFIAEYESGNGASISSDKIMEYLEAHNFTF